MPECPIVYAFRILTGKWKLQILWELTQEDGIRFNELQRRLTGISSFMLAKRLEELEHCKILIRKQYNEMPVRVEYTLTELGESIRPVMEMMADWGMEAQENMEGLI